MIDLHCHSHFSDGLHSPKDLLEKAVNAGITMLALTDHDTTKGLYELHKANTEKKLSIINGIELSCSWKKNDIHILGLNIQPDNPELKALIEEQNEGRIQRAKEIGQKLEAFSIKDAYEKACQIAGHTRVARPHFAKLLVDEGVVTDIPLAFKRFLKRGKSAYVPTLWCDIAKAVSVIVNAGGDAVIAHPLKYSLTRSKLIKLILEFKEVGGRGIEVVSSEMTEAEINDLAGLSQRYDLFASTGSDFHGERISRIFLGRQRQLPLNCKPIWQQWTIK